MGSLSHYYDFELSPRNLTNVFATKIADDESLSYYIIAFRNKRAQRALGRSPEEKVKGHNRANNREPQGHNLNNFGRGPFDDVIYIKYESTGPCSFRQEDF